MGAETNTEEEVGAGLPVLASTEQWSLIGVLGKAVHGGASPRYFVVWMDDNELLPRQLAVCSQMANARQLIPGVILEFKFEPSPGFVLTLRKGWEIQSEQAASQLLEKIVWEYKRLAA